MRLMSYNILEGGVGRADPLAEVIEAQNADVVVLVEADDADVVGRIVKRMKYDFVHAPGKGHAIAVLSRLTITRTINHALLNPGAPRSLLELWVKSPAGIDLPILSCHLHAKATEADEDIRLRELGCMLGITHDWRMSDQPHVLIGDFNSNSPIQQIDPANCKKATQNAWQANGGNLPRHLITNLLNHGYLDTLEVVHHEQAGEMYSFTTHETGQRVDYAFTHGIETSKITAAWIEQDRLAKFASDHYPIGCEIRI